MNKKITAIALATSAALLGLAGTASAADDGSGFYGALGWHQLNPKSDNGSIAGFRTDVNSASRPDLTLGYNFDQNWGAQVWMPLGKFENTLRQGGAAVADVKINPVLVTGQYHFLPGSTVNPYVGLGYGWMATTGERGTGAWAGNTVNVKNASGFVAQGGVDFKVADHVFIRADASYLNAAAKVDMNGIGAGKLKLDPWLYGVSVGYNF